MPRKGLEDAADVVEGGDEALAKLKDWLKELTSDADTKQGLVFKLWKVSKSGGNVPIENYDWDLGETVDDLATMIVEDADEETREHAGAKCHFRVETTVNHAQKKCGFVLRAISDVDEDGELDDEAGELPTARGLVAQQMRHHEFLTGQIVNLATGKREQESITVRELRDENRALRAQVQEYQFKMNELMDLRLQRDMIVDEHVRSETRKDDLAKGLKVALPLLANKFLGAGPEGEKAAQEFAGQSVMSASLQGFFDSLSDEQKETFGKTLSPVQQIMLVEIMNQANKGKSAETGNAAPGSPGQPPGPPPEKTASGKPYPRSANAASVKGNKAPFPRTG